MLVHEDGLIYLPKSHAITKGSLMALRTLLFSLLLLSSGVLLAAPDGARLYGQHCSVCHGSHGHGGVGVPLALPAFLATVDDDYLYKAIRNGRPGRVMPAFTDLSDVQIRAIVTHLRSWMPPGCPAS